LSVFIVFCCGIFSFLFVVWEIVKRVAGVLRFGKWDGEFLGVFVDMLCVFDGFWSYW